MHRYPIVVSQKNVGSYLDTPPPPKFNSEFTPEKWWERKTILSYWGPGNFSGAFAVQLREGSSIGNNWLSSSGEMPLT